MAESNSIRVALLQYPIEWADIETNLNLTQRRLAAIAGKADLALLPEMFTTGFCTDRPQLAEDADGLTIKYLQKWAKEYDMAIAGSYIAAEDQNLYNRGFFVLPDSTVVFADKRHLYAHGGEADFFTRGSERKIIEYKGCRFCLLICYDLRFPVWSRNQTGSDYDVLLYVANWPDIRIQYWDALLPARVIENQCVVCAVNRVGDDGIGLHYNGHSAVIDTRLKYLTSFADDEAATKIAEINIDSIKHFRQSSPLWKDSDRFVLSE